MQERYEETVSIHEGAEGKLIAEVASMELSENREVDVKQGKEEEEMQSCWKERMHHHHHGHGHGHGHHLRPHHHGHHLRLHHHGHHLHPYPHPHPHGHHPHPHPHHHHKEKKWEKLEKKKGNEGWNSKFVGKLKHKLEKIDWKIESLQEKKLFILSRIQEEEEKEKEKKKKNETPLPTDAA